MVLVLSYWFGKTMQIAAVVSQDIYSLLSVPCVCAAGGPGGHSVRHSFIHASRPTAVIHETTNLIVCFEVSTSLHVVILEQRLNSETNLPKTGLNWKAVAWHILVHYLKFK